MAEGGGRVCGECTLCCTVLRVDELDKLGGVPCPELRSPDRARALGGGCGIHARRPGICRRYRCAWLQGRFDEADRPDRLGAVLDLVTRGASTRLEVHLADPGAFERSPRLREIVERFRAFAPVRVLDTGDVLDPDRPYRVLLPDGEEQRVAGEVVTRLRDGRVVTTERQPWLERWLRRAVVAWRRRRYARLARRRPVGRGGRGGEAP